MTEAYITALVSLAAVSEILKQELMEEFCLIVLDQRLRPLEQQVIYAIPRVAERIVGESAERYAAGSGPST
jgi:hypothetical protein